ncbi:MAG TPA: YceI family protein [Chitinophagaceae bacterium]|nr:YceI family protein [Chitinophagaceae bacterium]
METTNATATGTKWVIDAAHSELVFKVKHLMISSVKGNFKSFRGEVKGEDFTQSPVELFIDTASITTHDDARDNHLRSADFFEAEQYPVIHFISTSLEKKSNEEYVLKGMLDMHGIRKEVTLDVEFGGIAKDPWGNEKAGFSVNGKINRKDWGLNWNAALEAGGVLVSEDVRIQAEIQLLKQGA